MPKRLDYILPYSPSKPPGHVYVTSERTRAIACDWYARNRERVAARRKAGRDARRGFKAMAGEKVRQGEIPYLPVKPKWDPKYKAQRAYYLRNRTRILAQQRHERLLGAFDRMP